MGSSQVASYQSLVMIRAVLGTIWRSILGRSRSLVSTKGQQQQKLAGCNPRWRLVVVLDIILSFPEAMAFYWTAISHRQQQYSSSKATTVFVQTRASEISTTTALLLLGQG